MNKVLQIGDEVFLAGAYRTHGAYIRIEKINRRSVKGTERPGSYGQGNTWHLCAGTHLNRQTLNKVKPFVTEEHFYLGDDGAML